jgi:hypothetical protein
VRPARIAGSLLVAGLALSPAIGGVRVGRRPRAGGRRDRGHTCSTGIAGLLALGAVLAGALAEADGAGAAFAAAAAASAAAALAALLRGGTLLPARGG